jgi:hypothetical protein
VTYDVPVGTAIVSYIEPHAGQARAFNRWYERDHFYAAVTGGPGVFSGARFVATRACKAVRPAAGRLFGDVSRGSFLSLAWLMPDAQPAWDAWVGEQMQTIVAEDRLFPGRDHVHTAVYQYAWSVGDGATAATALDHGFGVVVALAVARGHEDSLRRLDAPLVVALTQERLIVSVLDEPVIDAASHVLALAFVHGDVARAWCDTIEPALAGVPLLYASPFVRTIPGTDTYTDEL